MSLPAGMFVLLSIFSPRPVAQEIDRDLKALSSDEMGGRDTGSPHVARAEALIAERFRECMLEPLPGESGFRLPFVLEREGFDRACSAASVSGMPLVPEVDWRPFDFSGTGTVDAPVVFAGYGITSEHHGWDDYASLDVKGKAVLVLRHEPHETDPGSPFDGAESSSHATFVAKVANARDHGAAAILIVTDPLHHDEADDLRWGGPLRRPGQARREASGDDGPSIPAIQVSRAIAGHLVRGTGSSLAELQVATDERSLPASLPDLGRIRMSVERLADPEIVPATNVVGFLRGSDEALRDEWIVVGAHHDHVGMFHGEGDTIFNGADDNASGTVAVLQLACRFAWAPRPKRSLLFVTFAAEEKGLHGSRHLVENVLPMERVAFMLNSDMLGRNPERPIEAVGDGYTAGLRELIERAAEGLPLRIQYAGDGYFGASDHEPFYEEDVPFLFFFTGLHEDYHRVGDHHEKIDRSRLEALIALEQRVVRELADSPARPRFVHHVSWLGAHAEVREGRAVMTGLDAGGRGHAAGLREGDVVVSVDGEALVDPAEIGRAFRAVEAGDDAEVGVLRDGSPKAIRVRRPMPGWLGVAPGDVDPDVRRRLGLHPEDGLLVTTVIAEGPAARAGLRDGDILVSLGGRVVAQRTLQARLAQFGTGETITAVVVRDGERLELRVTLGERPQR